MFSICDILLIIMFICYIIPIKIVYNNYNDNYSISEMVTNENIKYNIFIWSILMGIFTVIYEFNRNYYSLLIIIFLLIGIIGIIFTKVKKKFCYHHIFTFIVFSSINIFMIFHIYINSNNILFVLFLLQILLIILTIKNVKSKIFYYECLLLLNFFIFYIYLHFLNIFNQ